MKRKNYKKVYFVIALINFIPMLIYCFFEACFYDFKETYIMCIDSFAERQRRITRKIFKPK